jgi:hypothetical protein
LAFVRGEADKFTQKVPFWRVRLRMRTGPET